MQDNMYLSPVKRDKLKKDLIKAKKVQMRALLPVLNKQDIRRYRLPYHESLLADLDEADFPNSAELIRRLIKNQDILMHAYFSITMTQTPLDIPHFKRIQQSLVVAESAQKQGNLGKEHDEMLSLAVHYSFGPSDLWWLGEQFLLQCLDISQHVKDNRKRECLSKYIYGKFFFNNTKNLRYAKYYLNESRKLSMEMPWTAAKILNTKEDTVFIESCVLLFKAKLSEAKNMLNSDPLEALRMCNLAKIRAAEACHYHGEYEALLLKGKCELLLGDTSAAIITFGKIIRTETRRNSVKEICEGRLQLAIAYIQHDNSMKALKTLAELTEFAHENALLYYVGQAFKYMGQLYLTMRKAQKSTVLLIAAFHIFHQENLIENREEARNLAAISAGDELMPMYIDLIVKCGSSDSHVSREHVLKLARWKDSREIFWRKSDDSINKQYSKSFNEIFNSNATSFNDEMSVTSGRELMEKEIQSVMLNFGNLNNDDADDTPGRSIELSVNIEEDFDQDESSDTGVKSDDGNVEAGDQVTVIKDAEEDNEGTASEETAADYSDNQEEMSNMNND